MGDAAAIGLIKTVTLDGLRSPENMNACISIIEDSFNSPDLIEVEVDRRPDVSMLLLKSMLDATDDPLLTDSIRTLLQKLSSRGVRGESSAI
jgi:hypothetical protein